MNSRRYMPVIDWAEIEASAPGRFVLIGEYADLFDKNAIAITIDRRTTVVIRPYNEGRLRLNLKNYDNVRQWPTTSFTMTRLVGKYADTFEYSELVPKQLNHLLHKRYTDSSQDIEAMKQIDDAVLAFLMLYIALGDSFAWSARPSIDVTINSTVPIGCGLGSSSAYSVAICAALMKVYRISAEPSVISNWALSIDRFFHGKASRLHTSAIVYGGYIYFQNNKVKYHGIPHLSPIKVMFIDTGVRIDPKSMIKKINSQQSENSQIVNLTFTSISDLAQLTWRKINDPNFSPRSIANYLKACQEMLDSLGLGNEKLSDIRSRADTLSLSEKLVQS